MTDNQKEKTKSKEKEEIKVDDSRVWKQNYNLENEFIMAKIFRNQSNVKNNIEIFNEEEKNIRKKKKSKNISNADGQGKKKNLDTDISNNVRKIMEKNKLKYEQERNEFLLQEKKLREERMEKTAKNREAIETEDNEWRKNVIDYQTEMFNRTLNKENKEENGNKRKNESKVNKEMELESNLNAFNRKMNELKQDAVLTKNEEERMQMYKKVKKEEYEMKKKEEEDLMLERSGKI